MLWAFDRKTNGLFVCFTPLEKARAVVDEPKKRDSVPLPASPMLRLCSPHSSLRAILPVSVLCTAHERDGGATEPNEIEFAFDCSTLLIELHSPALSGNKIPLKNLLSFFQHKKYIYKKKSSPPLRPRPPPRLNVPPPLPLTEP